METALTVIRDQQRDTWNKFSGGWKKWHHFTMNFLKPMGDEIISSLHLRDTDIVLDVASGTGEPAFTIAAIVQKGKVYATDVSEQMLDIAREYVADHQINNIEFVVADICELPFKNNFFDKLSCRMGFMFFPDMQMAANEMYRVCKNGGRMSTSVWAGPELNEWVTITMGVLSKYIEMPKLPPDAPGMFRCSKPGLMKSIMEIAGFKNVHERTITGKIDFESSDKYWQMMTDVAAPVVGALSKVDELTRLKIKQEVLEVCSSKLHGGRLLMDFSSIVITAEK